MLEPTWFIYYGALAVAGALLWDLRSKRRVPVWTLWTLFAEYAVQMVLPWDGTAGAFVNAAYALSVIVLIVLPSLGLAVVRGSRPVATEVREPALVP